MVKYNLYIIISGRCHYYTEQVKPYHWAFSIQKIVVGPQILGVAHQLHGMPGNFRYIGPEEMDLAKSGSRKETLDIDVIDESKMDKVHEILKNLRIDVVESSGWNCQDWALEGLDKLMEEGFVYDYMTKDTVKAWLRET